jgi:hypothetical protein
MQPLANCVSYALAVSGVQDGNGNAMVATNVTIPVLAAPKALMIVGNANALNLSDIAIRDRLDLLGYEVRPITATAANRRGASAANGFSLIYVSSTGGTTIGGNFRSVAVPTIVARRDLFDDYDMVQFSTNQGTVAAHSTLNIVNAAHPLADGLAAGVQTVINTVLGTRTFNWGSNVAASAIIVARINSATNTQPAHFGFEVGAAMWNGRTAASRRVGTYLEDNVAVFWNANGVALFDATVRWVAVPSIVQQPQSLVVAEGSPAQFCVVAGTTTAPAYQWYKNGSALSSQTSEKLTFASAQTSDSGNYTVVINNASGGSITSAVAVLTVVVPPVISSQPQGQTNVAGSNVTFSVTATGGVLSYQWKFNGSPIAGATSSTLTITNIQPANSGTYTVMVTNVAGMVTSDPAILRVLVRPTFTNVGISGGMIHGTISTVAGLKYTVQATDNLSPPITWTTLTMFTGDGSDVTLSEPVGSGNRFYRIIVE